MSQAQKAPEPGMEDLLASIRRAIGEDSAARSGGGSGLHMREAFGPRAAADRPQSEILELRNRIAGQLADRPAAPRPTGFAGILSGDVGLSASPAPSASAPPRRQAEDSPRLAQASGLRQSLAEPDREAAPPLPPVDESSHGQASEQAYAARDQNIHRPEEYDSSAYRRTEERRQSAYAPPAPVRHDRGQDLPREPGILSPETAAGAEAAFSRLADSLMSRALGERPIEDITRELLRTMLKQWLDEHLPALVERLVREEIERVARRGGR